MEILYIEDNPHNMRLVRKMLQTMSLTMLEAMDGMRGLRMAAEHRPDLILLDINLPDIDGLEVVQRLKADPSLAHIPTIALTANAMHGDREQCLASGFDGYLAKPIARMELKNILCQFLGEVQMAV